MATDCNIIIGVVESSGPIGVPLARVSSALRHVQSGGIVLALDRCKYSEPVYPNAVRRSAAGGLPEEESRHRNRTIHSASARRCRYSAFCPAVLYLWCWCGASQAGRSSGRRFRLVWESAAYAHRPLCFVCGSGCPRNSADPLKMHLLGGIHFEMTGDSSLNSCCWRLSHDVWME